MLLLLGDSATVAYATAAAPCLLPLTLRCPMRPVAFLRWPVVALLFLLGLLARPAAASPPPTGPAAASLAAALNPDGTLRPGADGAFDARHFRMDTAPDGRPVFRPSDWTYAIMKLRGTTWTPFCLDIH